MAKLVTFLGMHLRLPAEKDCGLTNRSTGHFAAVQFWAQKSSPKFAHRKVPVSSNVRRRNERCLHFHHSEYQNQPQLRLTGGK